MHIQQIRMHIPIIAVVELNFAITVFSFLCDLTIVWIGIRIAHITYLVNR